jgi:DNA repair protein RadC
VQCDCAEWFLAGRGCEQYQTLPGAAGARESEVMKEIYQFLEIPEKLQGRRVITTKRAAKIARPIADDDIEKMVCVTLTDDYLPINARIVSTGSECRSYVSISDVMRAALVDDARGIVVLHNHPSGDLRGSIGDSECLKEFQRAGDFLRVPVLDFVIVHGKKYKTLIGSREVD